jgi:hypothetical protein
MIMEMNLLMMMKAMTTAIMTILKNRLLAFMFHC